MSFLIQDIDNDPRLNSQHQLNLLWSKKLQSTQNPRMNQQQLQPRNSGQPVQNRSSQRQLLVIMKYSPHRLVRFFLFFSFLNCRFIFCSLGRQSLYLRRSHYPSLSLSFFLSFFFYADCHSGRGILFYPCPKKPVIIRNLFFRVLMS